MLGSYGSRGLSNALHDLKAVVGLPHAEQAGTLVGVDVGAVEDEVELAVKAVEEHTVAAVLIVDEVIGVAPGAADTAAVADGQGLDIPVLRARMEARPQHIELAVLTSAEEGTVCNIIAGGGIHQGVGPRGTAGSEDGLGRAHRGGEILGQGHDLNGAVAYLSPLMAEGCPGIALIVHIESSIQTGPVAGGHGAISKGQEGAHGAVAPQDLGGTGNVPAAEAGEHIVGVTVMVNLGSEKVPIRPEIRGAGEALVGLTPLHEVGGGVDVQTLPGDNLGAGAAAGAVEIVNAIFGKDEGVAEMDIRKLHNGLLEVDYSPVL